MKNIIYKIFLAFCVFLPFQFALNPAPGIDLAVARVIILLFSLMLIAYILKNRAWRIFKSNISLLILAFLLLAIFSIFLSANVSWSVRKLLFLFSVFPIYYFSIFFIDSLEKKQQVASCLVLGASLAAIVGAIQFLAQFLFGIDPVYDFIAKKISPFFLGNSFSEAVLAYPSWLVSSNERTYMRAISFFPDPHMFSYYLGMLIPWSLALWSLKTPHKKFFLFSSFLLIAADLMTFTRGSYVAIIASTFLVLPLVPRAAAKKLLLGIAIFVLAFSISPRNPVSGRFVSSFDVQEGSNQERISNWEQATNIIAENPFGVGIGAYSLAVNPNTKYREPIYAHDLYLDIAAEMGLFSAFIFAAILFFALKNFYQASKKQPFFTAGIASILVFSIHSLVETPLYSIHILTLILIILALGNFSKPDKNHAL